ncbi:MAG TPA: hypothetical protein VF595_18355 [Tepidisphaeraceae bacterium]
MVPHFDTVAAQYLFYFTAAIAGIVLFVLGYKIGQWVAAGRYTRELDSSRRDLFTTQAGFKKLYEGEIHGLKIANDKLTADNEQLTKRVEDYRRKAAGFGGLFNSGGKKADAMYALLLENEAMEEQLHKQNTKFNAERSDAVQESLRNIGYRRVLMSQLLNDNRIKDYVREILEDEGRLPPPGDKREQAKLPHAGE